MTAARAPIRHIKPSRSTETATTLTWSRAESSRFSAFYTASRVIVPLIVRHMPSGFSFFSSSGKQACGKSW